MKSQRHTSPEGIHVTQLGHSEWRISQASDPDHLLGFIERQRAGRFEIVWMADPMRWGYAASFEDALLAFGDSVRFTGEIFARRATVVGRSSADLGAALRGRKSRRSTWIKRNGHSSVA